VLGQAAPELNFTHLLTRLDIALVTSEETAAFTVTELKLIRTAGDKDDKLNTVCKVALNEENLEDAVSFSDGSTTKLACYQPGGDSEFESMTINKTSSNDVVAYILAPSLKADEVYPGEIDYTLEVTYSIDGKTSDTKTAEINLQKNDPPGGAYKDDTSGKRFIVTLTFAAGGIAATAEIIQWTEVKQDKNVSLDKVDLETVTTLADTGAEDKLTNCYMVEPGKELVFPVGRAYVYNTSKLRIAPTSDYNGTFTAKVLWDTSNVIKVGPIVSKTGKDTKVYLKTNATATGNALVALCNDAGTIVWSYHIWVTTYKPTYSGNAWFEHTNVKFWPMAVDLGDEITKTRTNADGLVYEWGRKDPFYYNAAKTPQAQWTTVLKDATNAKFVELTKYPTRFIYFNSANTIIGEDDENRKWYSLGGYKSITDPCPLNYRVIQTTYTSINTAYAMINNAVTWKYDNRTDNGQRLVSGTEYIWSFRRDLILWDLSIQQGYSTASQSYTWWGHLRTSRWTWKGVGQDNWGPGNAKMFMASLPNDSRYSYEDEYTWAAATVRCAYHIKQ
jgi:hypothetical protein